MHAVVSNLHPDKGAKTTTTTTTLPFFPVRAIAALVYTGIDIFVAGQLWMPLFPE